VLAQFGNEDVALNDKPGGGPGGGAVEAAQPGLTQANAAASEPLHEPASANDGAGTEPKPVDNQPVCPLAHLQHDLADVITGFHTSVRRRGFGERKDLVHHWP
jgi:hypothetical protein